MPSEQRSKESLPKLAARVKRPGWKDPRLALGAALITASVIGTVFLVRGMNETTSVYVAATNITLGEQLTHENLKTKEVQLGDSLQHYLVVEETQLEQARANTFIEAGELIPQTSITSSQLGSRRPVNIELPTGLSEAITPGTFVDVWVAKREAGGAAYGVPDQLATMVEVSARSDRAGGIVGNNGTNLELLVEADALESFLQALANDARLTVIYNPAGDQT
ncbi:flagellar protein FlgA [Glutamicibacter uratoxydans]|uniref:Flagellar protein FlgA n=2 Tax=Glutamicibacter uratoxydans TaxID=43667 RepID=A0A4Y4DTY7_GLUUR|nr:flagellar protein FlgA [Glutamicibacter uratoxydans]